MSPESEESPQAQAEAELEKTESAATKNTNATTRRRTKTGCLTCRKRRIKCGEERPKCKNCIKSKRECAGYNPPSSTHHQPAQALTPTSLSNNPFGQYVFPHQPFAMQAYPALGPAQDSVPFRQQGANVPHTMLQMPFGSVHGIEPTQAHFDASGAHLLNPWTRANTTTPIAAPTSISGFTPQYHAAAYPLDVQQSLGNEQRVPAHSADAPFHHATNESYLTPASNTYGSESTAKPLETCDQSATVRIRSTPSDQIAYHSFKVSHSAPSEPLYVDSVDDPDDPFDVEDDFADQIWLETGAIPPTNASIFPSSQQIGGHCGQGSTQSAVVRAPKPPMQSPLLEERNQEFFRHFLNITAPSMGIFDRLGDDGTGGPKKTIWTRDLCQMAFSHPALAHAILAISALQSSSIQNQSQGPAVKHFTYALRRIKPQLESDQIRSHVSTLATILLLAYYEVIAGDHSRWNLHVSGAAKLVMERNYAEMFRTVRRMRARAKSNVARHWTPDKMLGHEDMVRIADIPEWFLDDADWDIDQNLVAEFMGMQVDYAHQQQPNFSNLSQSYMPDFTPAGAADLKVAMDLFWWYCKQDLYQSMLSGDAPLLSYSYWRFCQPRGRIGLSDRPHASADYLWLLLARIVIFGAKDRKRKLRFIAARGGEWVPPPGFLPKPPQQQSQTTSSKPSAPPMANEGRARSARTNAQTGVAGLPMYGMIPPPTEPVKMSSSFKELAAELAEHGTSSLSPESVDSFSTPNHEGDLERALEDHGSISKALEKYGSLLGEGFDPLPSEQWLTTPFGPAVRYKSPVIATIRTYLLVARILLRRMHPHSPPAAMVSSGVNSSVTHADAQMIGRICGGLYAQHSYLAQTSQMDHFFTGALIETSFALMFAGVQYFDPAQRVWTITKLNDIANMTGWASARAIAAACETTWLAMHEAGKGPPHQRVTISRLSELRAATQASKIDQIPISHTADLAQVREHESRFVNHDRNLIDRHASSRAYWALGVLSVTEDLKKMELAEDEARR